MTTAGSHDIAQGAGRGPSSRCTPAPQSNRDTTFSKFNAVYIYNVEYIDIRHLYFNVNTVRELFDTVPPVLFVSFIRRAGLLYLI